MAKIDVKDSRTIVESSRLSLKEISRFRADSSTRADDWANILEG